MDKNLLIEIFVPTQGQMGHLATGFPVWTNRILTARHVLFPPGRTETSSPILVRWHHQQGPAHDWRQIRAIVWEGGDTFDAALLDCDFPEGVSQWSLLSNSKPAETMHWMSEGFPRVGERDDQSRRAIPMQGNVYSMADSATEFDLGVDDPHNLPGGWKGVSGCPVFANDAIVGVIVSCPADFEQRRLYATPTWKLLQDKAFLQSLTRDPNPGAPFGPGNPPGSTDNNNRGAKAPELRTPLPQEPKIDLLGRNSETNHLHVLYNKSPHPVVCIYGPEGCGKTYLVSKFAKKVTESPSRNVWPFWYSFPSKEIETSPDIPSSAFFTKALHAFGYPDPLPVHEDERRIALSTLIRTKNALLILDSIENVQELTTPDEQKTSDGQTIIHGRIKDAQLNLFLHSLAKEPLTSGLVVICSRHAPIDLQGFIDSGGYKEIELGPLAPETGADFLRSMNVHGGGQNSSMTQAVLEELSTMLCGNPMLLLLFGGFILKNFEGNAGRWKQESHVFDSKVPGELIEVLLALHNKNLPNVQRAFLRLLGLFGQAMAAEDFRVLRDSTAGKPLRGLLDWELSDMFEALVKCKLLSPKSQDARKWDRWDTHTVVRQYFGDQLKKIYPGQWEDAHNKLFEHYKNVADNFSKKPTLSEAQRMFGVVRHGCHAGRYADAYAFYRDTIAKNWEGYDTEVLGMVTDARIAISSILHNESFDDVVDGLEEVDTAWLFARDAYCLESLGKFKDSVVARERSNAEYHSLYDAAAEGSFAAFERARDVANGSEELAGIQMRLGELRLAEENGRTAVLWASLASQCADKSRQARTWQEPGKESKNVPPWLRQCSTLSALGAALHWRGKLQEAAKCFERAQSIHNEHETEWVLHSEPGVRYCALRLDLAETRSEREEVFTYAQEMKKWNAMGHIKGLHFMIEACALKELEKLYEAERAADESVELIGGAHKVQFLCGALLVRAGIRRLSGALPAALNDVQEAVEISRAGEMTPYLANGYLLSAHIALDKNDDVRAEKDLDEARRLILPENKQDCYRLRLAEVCLLEARLKNFRSVGHDIISKSLDHAQRHISNTGFVGLNDQMRLYREGRWER